MCLRCGCAVRCLQSNDVRRLQQSPATVDNLRPHPRPISTSTPATPGRPPVHDAVRLLSEITSPLCSIVVVIFTSMPRTASPIRGWAAESRLPVVRSQVWRGRPGRRFQSLEIPRIDARCLTMYGCGYTPCLKKTKQTCFCQNCVKFKIVRTCARSVPHVHGHKRSDGGATGWSRHQWSTGRTAPNHWRDAIEHK